MFPSLLLAASEIQLSSISKLEEYGHSKRVTLMYIPESTWLTTHVWPTYPYETGVRYDHMLTICYPLTGNAAPRYAWNRPFRIVHCTVPRALAEKEAVLSSVRASGEFPMRSLGHFEGPWSARRDARATFLSHWKSALLLGTVEFIYQTTKAYLKRAISSWLQFNYSETLAAKRRQVSWTSQTCAASLACMLDVSSIHVCINVT